MVYDDYPADRLVYDVPQGDVEKTKEIEGSVIDCLLTMVMKLSEVTFRPLFFKVQIRASHSED